MSYFLMKVAQNQVWTKYIYNYVNTCFIIFHTFTNAIFLSVLFVGKIAEDMKSNTFINCVLIDCHYQQCSQLCLPLNIKQNCHPPLSTHWAVGLIESNFRAPSCRPGSLCQLRYLHRITVSFNLNNLVEIGCRRSCNGTDHTY